MSLSCQIPLSDYHKRKENRRRIHDITSGVKMETCTACNGTGLYDVAGSPNCDACSGSGKTLPSSAWHALNAVELYPI